MQQAAYPLAWPAGWPRTMRPVPSQFKTDFGLARNCLMYEVRRLGGTDIVLSTNIPLRNDGLPYANFKIPADVGVAIYFTYKGKPMVFACDKYQRVEDNLQAIRKTIEALRGIERWGASDMMERAFTGFQQLTGPATRSPWQVLGVPETASPGEIHRAYLDKARKHHPDAGGSATAMAEVNAAYDELQRMGKA